MIVHCYMIYQFYETAKIYIELFTSKKKEHTFALRMQNRSLNYIYLYYFIEPRNEILIYLQLHKADLDYIYKEGIKH